MIRRSKLYFIGPTVFEPESLRAHWDEGRKTSVCQPILGTL